MDDRSDTAPEKEPVKAGLFSWLHLALFLPFLSLFTPLSFAPSISLDELIVLAFLPMTLLFTPLPRLAATYKLLLIVSLLCLINLSLVFYPVNFAEQFVNILAFFSFFCIRSTPPEL